MKFDFKKILLGVLAASVISRIYDNITVNMNHENRNMHEALMLIAIFAIILNIPDSD